MNGLPARDRMSSTEKYCLKYNDFQKNISTSFQGLRQNTEFADDIYGRKTRALFADGEGYQTHRQQQQTFVFTRNLGHSAPPFLAPAVGWEPCGPPA